MAFFLGAPSDQPSSVTSTTVPTPEMLASYLGDVVGEPTPAGRTAAVGLCLPRTPVKSRDRLIVDLSVIVRLFGTDQ